MSETHRLCALADIEEGQARGFEFGRKSVIAVVRDGNLYTFVNWCPHLGIALNFYPDEFLDQERQFLMCANHGALFEIETGECVSGPCQGETLLPVPHDIRDGDIWVTLMEPPT